MTAAEITTNISNGFLTLDKNLDGVITSKELGSARADVVKVVGDLFEVSPEDTQVTRNEVVFGIDKAFAKVDINSDGIINKDELKSTNSESAANQSTRSMKSKDQNQDGLLSSQEAFNFVNSISSRGFDINQDNKISPSELQAYFSEQISNQQINSLDDNRSVNIDLNEYGKSSLARFNSLDRDNDGIIDLNK